MGSISSAAIARMQIIIVFVLILSMSFAKEIERDNHVQIDEETTWDPWSPCEDDSECPDDLMCNTRQHRCTECMDSEDCPPCMEDDCYHQGEGTCVYGDHCCTADFC